MFLIQALLPAQPFNKYITNSRTIGFWHDLCLLNIYLNDKRLLMINSNCKTQHGFTLIELMTVMGVIGILASIALPSYNSYIAKSQHSAGLAEITPGKVMMEINLMESVGTFSTPDSIGLPNSSANCSAINVVTDNTTGDASVTCTLRGNAAIIGKTVQWVRAPSGVWTCISTAEPQYNAGCY